MRYSIWILLLCLINHSTSWAQFPLKDIDVEINNEILDFPFTGGFTNAQFNNIDLNRDGALDLVVFDRDGNLVRSFLYDTLQNKLTYAPDYDRQFPELDNFLIIRDYNKDGIEDLFTYSHIPGIAGVQIFKGKLNGNILSWERVEFANHRDIIMYKTRNGNFVNAYVSSIDIPSIVDVDMDGDIDLLSFEPGGSYIYYYKNTAVENGYSLDSLTFTLADQCWGKVYEAETNEELSLSDDPDQCADALTSGGNATTRHSGSTLQSLDLDNNGLMDLLVGDLSSPNIIALFNGGTAENAWGTAQESMYPRDDMPIDLPVFVATFYVDVDNDGINELIASPNTENAARNRSNIWLYENNAPTIQGLDPSFVKPDFLLDKTIDLSGASVPAIADVNQDGLPDLVIGTYGIQDQTGQIEPRVFLFHNTGSLNQPEFQLADDDYLQLSDYKGNQFFSFAPAFGDIDDDGDQDLLLGNFSGGLFFFENTAGPGRPFVFAEEIVGYMDIDVGQFSVPQIIDVNSDGLMDLLIGERNGNSVNGIACGNINYFQNIGTSGNPSFDPEEQNAPNTPCYGDIFTREQSSITGYSSPQLIRFSDKDWLITGSESRNILFYENKADIFSPFELKYEQWGQVNEGRRTHPRMYDLDQDGDYELIVGNNRGGISIYGTDANTDGQIAYSENSSLEEINIFPNPGTDHFMIHSTADIKEVRIIDLSGRELIYLKNTQRINTSSLMRGLYIIEISTHNGRLLKKWLKH